MRRRAQLRLLAGPLAVLWAVLPALLGEHSLAERHERCAEHHRIEHRAAFALGVAQVAPSRVRGWARGTGHELPAHVACTLAESMAGHAVSVRAPLALTTSLPAVPSAPVIAWPLAPAGRPALIVAPKQSPPSLAV